MVIKWVVRDNGLDLLTGFGIGCTLGAILFIDWIYVRETKREGLYFRGVE